MKKRCFAIKALIGVIATSVVLSLGYLTIRDMYSEVSPNAMEVEAGTYNLTASDLGTTAEEIGKYTFYTNYTQIKVTVQGDNSFQGTVMLWDAADNSGFIQTNDVNEVENSCTFTCNSAARRYQITCDNLDGTALTISEGRTVSFWRSLKSAINEIMGR